MMCDERRHPHRARAFTLIEVLMAAFIIGLGVLGLAALFAGAAFQQQVSSEITSSIMLSRSAESTIANQIGTLEAECNVSNPDSRYRPGVWYPITTTNSRVNDPRVGMLTADPSGNDEWFFAASPAEPMPRVLFGRSLPYAGEIRGRLFTAQELSNNSLVRDFGQSRILADSVAIEVTLTRFPCVDGARNRSNAQRRTLRFLYDDQGNPCPPATQLATFVSGNSWIDIDLQRFAETGDANASIENLYIEEIARGSNALEVVLGTGNFVGCSPDPTIEVLEARSDLDASSATGFMVPDPSGDFHVINDPREFIAYYQVNGFSGDVYSFLPGGRPETLTQSFAQLGPGGTHRSGASTDPGAIPVRTALIVDSFIDRIELVDYRWRATEIASLSQRIRYQPDPARADGQRPVMAYSVLFRRLEGTDATQVVIFTYALNSGSARAEFVPPESPVNVTNGDAPIRSGRLRIDYDDDERAYYVTATTAAYEWMIDPGQLLLFAGNNTISGADAPVRINRVRTIDDQRRGYLEGAPRVAGRNLLFDLAEGGFFEVWAIQPTIRSVTDSSTWSLKPIEARVLQVSSN